MKHQKPQKQLFLVCKQLNNSSRQSPTNKVTKAFLYLFQSWIRLKVFLLINCDFINDERWLRKNLRKNCHCKWGGCRVCPSASLKSESPELLPLWTYRCLIVLDIKGNSSDFTHQRRFSGLLRALLLM